MRFLETHRSLLVLNVSAVIIFISLAIIRGVGVTPFDTQTLTFFQGLQGQTATDIMVGISDALNPYMLLALSLLFSSYLIVKKNTGWALFFLLSLLCALLSAVWFKDFFQMMRPVQSVVPEIGWGFPSSHATGVAVFFFSLFYAIDKKIHDSAVVLLWFLVSVGLVLGTGLSRVYLGVHFATDVLAGFALGTFWVTLAILVFEKLHEKQFPRFPYTSSL